MHLKNRNRSITLFLEDLFLEEETIEEKNENKTVLPRYVLYQVRAIKGYSARTAAELSFEEGDIIDIIDDGYATSTGLVLGVFKGKKGIFPLLNTYRITALENNDGEETETVRNQKGERSLSLPKESDDRKNEGVSAYLRLTLKLHWAIGDGLRNFERWSNDETVLYFRFIQAVVLKMWSVDPLGSAAPLYGVRGVSHATLRFRSYTDSERPHEKIEICAILD
ncbi:SH3 domain-containing protein [Trichonephila clavipes]|uniref:SH3 domain-containing protein n=1 Tax=Trichonephila clavipes TaxID=2585209 RepID=A0A8X7BEB0_TRICX|nr:SH3 domain-containing protein [Trichonephila clavipes]